MCLWRFFLCENIFWQISLSWGYSLRWIAVMCLWRLFLWFFLTKFTLMRLFFEVVAVMCFWRWYFLENISWQISLSWGFYLRWIAVMCLWRLLFSENIFWQIHTHEASFRWTVVMCFWKWPLSGILFWQNWYSHVNWSATTVRCTVERERESGSESGFWYAKLKGFMPANIGFSFRAIKLWYSSNMWWQKFLNIRVN